MKKKVSLQDAKWKVLVESDCISFIEKQEKYSFFWSIITDDNVGIDRHNIQQNGTSKNKQDALMKGLTFCKLNGFKNVEVVK